MPHHGSILAVDDTEASLQILSDLLREAGHSVRTALSGKLALLSAAHRVPDLILLDIRMPGMDGFEVCRQLKAQADTRDVPVIFISALSDTDEKIRSFQLGAVDYVTKPFQRDELLARVSTHIHLRRMQLQVHTQNEELRQYRAQLEDLVAQRTAELQNSNQRLKLMSYALDQVREAAYLIGPEGTFHYVNQEACRAHGYSAEELGQMHLRDIDPNFSEEFFSAHWRTFTPTDASTFETLHRRRDGSVFPVEVHSSIIRFDGRDLSLSLARDISERKEAEQRLHDSYAQLQVLNSRRESDREDERKRIAHELHDELGQCLTALRIGISTLRYREERDSAWLDGRLVALTAQVDDTIRVVRSVTVALRPPVLGMGIGPALEWLVAQFQKTTDLSCEVHIPSDFCGLTEAASVALYRIVQEALTNVARHSQARTVRIFGQHNGGGCQLNIVDDGSGIHAWALDGPSLGLLGMRERAQQLGGTVVVDAAPGRGTRVSVWIPSQHADT
ncbi:hybrid sensor histidine kinase/response regulator [Hydrogenophaga soli]